MPASSTRILAGRPAGDFIGRDEPARRLFAHARSSKEGLLLLHTPGAGASELLKQVYDRLFREQKDVVPFYFSVRAFDSAADIAAAFVDEFLRQLVAFRRQEPGVILPPGDMDELAELSLAVGGFWIDRLIDSARAASSGADRGRAFIRSCLAAPLRAAANDARSVVMIDDAHLLLDIDGGVPLLSEVKEVFETGGIPFVVAGHRRFLHGRLDCPRMELDHLDPQNA